MTFSSMSKGEIAFVSKQMDKKVDNLTVYEHLGHECKKTAALGPYPPIRLQSLEYCYEISSHYDTVCRISILTRWRPR